MVFFGAGSKSKQSTKVFSVKFVFFTNSRKFSPSKVSRYKVYGKVYFAVTTRTVTFKICFTMLPIVHLQTGMGLHLPSALHTAVISPSRIKPSSQQYCALTPQYSGVITHNSINKDRWRSTVNCNKFCKLFMIVDFIHQLNHLTEQSPSLISRHTSV